MATWSNAYSFTAPSSVDASVAFGAAGIGSYQYRAVGRNTSNQIVVADGTAVLFEGILQDDPKIGQHGTVKFALGSKAVAGASFNANAKLKVATDGTGRFVDAAAGAYVALALEAAAGANSIVHVVLVRGSGIN